jgi:ATP-grasp domain, R2K clade family 3
MQFIYPHSMLNARVPDEFFQEEVTALSRAGHTISLIESEALATGTAKLKPIHDTSIPYVYRGWMLSSMEYQNLEITIANQSALLFTSLEKYLSTHHLPNWYSLIADLTPETVFISLESDWTLELQNLGWNKFFIKDYVKSLKTSVGSIIERPEDIHIVTAEMQKYRGTIEGGLCIRRVENLIPATEQRFFALNKKVFSAEINVTIPDIVLECANRIDSKFFSIDVIQRDDGQLRIVEIGDGQVSDLVGWSIERFVEIWETSN